MSLTSENGNGMVMPVSPMYGNGGGLGGFGGWGDGAWIIILLLFAFGNGGFGGWGGMGNGNVGGMLYPWMNQAQLTQGGFDQAATASALAGIQTSITNGFSNAEVASCQRAITDMQTAYNNQIANMNQQFATAQALDGRLDAITTAQATCCCETKGAIKDVAYQIATEGCADRVAITDALKDVIAANTASTQRILDQMCNDKIDAKNERIAELQNQLSMAQLAASQNAQTAAIQAGQRALANEVEQYVLPTPRPAYIVQNPNCCAPNYGYGCGCGA